MEEQGQQPRQARGGDETQIIPPVRTGIRGTGEPEAKPLDLPRGPFGGYQATAVERYVAELLNSIEIARNTISGLRQDNTRLGRDMETLRQQFADITRERDQYRHKAENPLKNLGEVGQQVIDYANQQADGIHEKANADAARIIQDAKTKADRIAHQAEQDIRNKQAQAQTTLAQARTTATSLTDEAHGKAERLLDEARRNADALDRESRKRAEQAAAREQTADLAVTRAIQLLTDAARSLDATPARKTGTEDTRQ